MDTEYYLLVITEMVELANTQINLFAMLFDNFWCIDWFVFFLCFTNLFFDLFILVTPARSFARLPVRSFSGQPWNHYHYHHHYQSTTIIIYIILLTSYHPVTYLLFITGASVRWFLICIQQPQVAQIPGAPRYHLVGLYPVSLVCKHYMVLITFALPCYYYPL